MKKRICLTLALCLVLVLAIFAFAGCAAQPQTPAEPSVTPEATSEPVQPEAPAEPTDAEITKMYEDANEAYLWFDMGSCPTTGGEECTTPDGMTYGKADIGFANTAELTAYLKTLFSDEIVERLMTSDHPTFIDNDGALYVSAAARGANIFAGDSHYEVIRENGKIVYRVSVDQLEEPGSDVVASVETYDMVIENVNGNWLFTSFEATV